MTRPEVLDCTLRDGSYPVAYQFSEEDTMLIAAGLEDAGFDRIEVGHGLGLGASQPEIGVAAVSDEQYLRAADSVLDRARFGAFFIPGIGSREHLELARECGAGFIRIGTNVNETEEALSYIRRAKELGLEVSANLMKTYALPVRQVVPRAQELDEAGADVIAIVDSSGTMLPEQVEEYVGGVEAEVEARVGFHGHDNLRLGVANSLAAIDAGGDIVDGSLKGLGRSAGNAQTEVLVAVLEKRGFDLGIDLFATMKLGDRLVEPFTQGSGVSSVDVASGFGGFHSKFLDLVRKVADDTGVSLHRLIVEVGNEEKVEVTEEVVRSCARDLEHDAGSSPRARTTRSFELSNVSGTDGSGSDWRSAARTAVERIRQLAEKTHRTSVLSIAGPPLAEHTDPRFPFVRGNATSAIGNAEVSTVEQAREIVRIADGRVDYIAPDTRAGRVADNSLYAAIRSIPDESDVLPYNDREAHLDAAEQLVLHLHTSPSSIALGVCGLSPFGLELAHRFVQAGFSVELWDERAAVLDEGVNLLQNWVRLDNCGPDAVPGRLAEGRTIETLLATSLERGSAPEPLIDAVREGGTVIDLGIGTFTEEALKSAGRRGLEVVRIDMRAGSIGQVTTSLETKNLVERVMGRTTLGGQTVVAGGWVGRDGDVVVDEAVDPTRVIGVADGLGGIKLSDQLTTKDVEAVETVRQAILEHRVGERLASP